MKDETAFLRILSASNPWWESNRVPPVLAPEFRRRDFYPLREEMSDRRVTVVAGPRQVGKTTLLYQLVQDLLSRRVDPKTVLFLAMDFPRLQQVADEALTDALELWGERILAKPWRDLDGGFVFLDEVTKVADWHRTLKGWYDRRLPLKFAITDSSLAAVKSGIAQSLVGRAAIHVVLPMKFVDALMFQDGREEFNDMSLTLRDALVAGVRSGSPTSFFDACRAVQGRLAPRERTILARLRAYLFSDGYPELLRQTDWSALARRLREYLDLVFARDLLRLFEIRNPRALSALVGLLADQTAGRFEYTGLAKNVGISVDALREYLDYLEDAFLIIRSEFHTRSRASRLRKQKKIYFGNVGLANTLTGNVGPQLLEDSGYLGRLVETLVADHCKRLLSSLEPGRDPQLAYWRNYRGQEVDIVVRIAGRPVPIEVKYQTRITGSDRRPVIDFLEEEKDTPFGMVVTRDSLRLEEDILEIPLHLFLLLS